MISRLFIGTFLSAQQQDHLGRLRDQNDRLTSLWNQKLRWVKSKKLHLTWLFLGEVKEDLKPKIIDRLSTLISSKSSLTITYDHAQFWPTPSKARQLVLTSQVVPSVASELAMDIRYKLADLVSKPDDHPFRPHITLLRFDSHHQHPPHIPPQLPDFPELDQTLPLLHTIESISLIESHLGAVQDDYQTLESFNL